MEHLSRRASGRSRLPEKVIGMVLEGGSVDYQPFWRTKLGQIVGYCSIQAVLRLRGRMVH